MQRAWRADSACTARAGATPALTLTLTLTPTVTLILTPTLALTLTRCDPGYAGKSCAETAKCPNDCNLLGVCFQGKCHHLTQALALPLPPTPTPTTPPTPTPTPNPYP